MRMTTGAAVLLFFVALLPEAALAQGVVACSPTAGHGGILTGLAQQFSTTTGPWTAIALRYAQGLFFALVGIEIAWSAITYVLQKDSLPDFVAALLLKILSIGFFYTVLQPKYGPVWIADVIASFSQAGSAIGGQTQFGPSDPSSIFNCGTDIANAMLQSVSQNPGGINLGNILPAIEAVLAALVCALGVVIAFAIIAGQLLITLIESYIVIGAGVFMLGFTGSRWTLVFGEKYVGYAVSVGIKLFMLELIVGLGYGLGRSWASLFYNGIAPPETYIEVVGAALVFGFLAWQVPSLAGSLMNGAPRMTLGSFLSTAGTVAVGGAIVGSGVGGIVAGGRALGSGKTDTIRTAGDVGDSSNGYALTTTRSAQSNGRSSASDELGSRSHSPDFDSFATSPESAHGAHEHADEDTRADGRSQASGPASEAHDPRQPRDATESEVTAEDVATTSAADAAVADENTRAARDAERHDIQVATTGSPTPRVNPMQGFRPPPIPDDSDDGNIQIRFKHPE